MKSSSADPHVVSQPGRAQIFLILAVSLGICLLAISDQSLWIDEALTAWKARQPTLTDWWDAIVEEKASDLQMPLYMIYMWAYEKVLGSTEWILRSANLPWLVFGMVAFSTALSSSRQRALAVTLVAGLSPFAWYYLNEARPYAMQLGASLFAFGALHRLNQKPSATDARERFWVLGFFIALIVLCGSSMLGMIWAASALGVAGVILARSRMAELFRLHGAACLAAVGCLGLLGIYYLWTLKIGARASGAAITDWKNLFFIGYELLGFSGLGPGRLEIREGGLSVFRPYGIGLALYGAAVLVVVVVALRQLFSRDRRLLFKLALIIGAPGMVLMIAGLVMHFRVLGRHFAPLIPVVLFLLSIGVATLWSRRGRLGKLIVCGFILLMLFSCLSLRFAARHEKDDYRDAAVYARVALQSGKQVWWNADQQGAAYYQVPTTNRPMEIGKAWWVVNPSRELLSDAPLPEVIIASKPDLFDSQSALVDYLARAGFGKVATLPAFTVWQGNAE